MRAVFSVSRARGRQPSRSLRSRLEDAPVVQFLPLAHDERLAQQTLLARHVLLDGLRLLRATRQLLSRTLDVEVEVRAQDAHRRRGVLGPSNCERARQELFSVVVQLHGLQFRGLVFEGVAAKADFVRGPLERVPVSETRLHLFQIYE